MNMKMQGVMVTRENVTIETDARSALEAVEALWRKREGIKPDAWVNLRGEWAYESDPDRLSHSTRQIHRPATEEEQSIAKAFELLKLTVL